MTLTDTEALEALFDSSAGHLTLSPVLPQTFSSKQDQNGSSYSSDGPLSNTIRWSSSSASALTTNTTNSSCAGVRRCPSPSFIQPRRATIPLDPPNSPWKLESKANSHSSLTESNRTLTFSSTSPLPQLERNPQGFQNISPACSPVLSRSISSFDLIGTIGCGAYGKVLLGHLGNDFSRNLHAIKVLRKRDMHQYGVEEVKRELCALRWISDTVKSGSDSMNGVTFLQQFLESFQNEHFVFIVLEYHPVSLANPEVARRLRLHFPAPPGVSASISLPLSFSPVLPSPHELHSSTMESLTLVAAELVLGILFLHQSGIVHQDLKPANIMISETGHVVIADFGASTALPFSLEYEDCPIVPGPKVIKKSYHAITLQPQDIITFTPLYAAPELMFRNRAGLVIYDQRVDWWSFGVMLYELGTGSVPFRASQSEAGGQDRCRFSRRSVGDFSLSFGALEKLSLTFRDVEGSNGGQLEAFLRALLVEHAPDRLSEDDVKHHSFFDSIAHMWEDISAMRCPPIPYPPTVSLDPDVSLSMNRYGDTESCEKSPTTQEGRLEEGKLSAVGQTSFDQVDLRNTWPMARDDEDEANNSNEERVETHSHSRSMRALRETVSVDSLAESLLPPSSDSDSFGFDFLLDSDRRENQQDEDVQEFNEYTEQESDVGSQIQPFPSTASLYFATEEEDVIPMEEDRDETCTVLEGCVEEREYPNMEEEEEEEGEIELEEVEEWNPWSPSGSKDDSLNQKTESLISQGHDSGVDVDVSPNAGDDQDESGSTVSPTDGVFSQNNLHFSEPSDLPLPHAVFSPRPAIEDLLLPRSQSQRLRQVSSPSSSSSVPPQGQRQRQRQSRPPTPPSHSSSLIPSDDLEREMGAEKEWKWKKSGRRNRRFSVPLLIPRRGTATPKQGSDGARAMTWSLSRSRTRTRTGLVRCSLPLSGKKSFFRTGVGVEVCHRSSEHQHQHRESISPTPTRSQARSNRNRGYRDSESCNGNCTQCSCQLEPEPNLDSSLSRTTGPGPGNTTTTTTTGATTRTLSEWQVLGSWSLEERLTISVLDAMDSRDMNLGFTSVPVTPATPTPAFGTPGTPAAPGTPGIPAESGTPGTPPGAGAVGARTRSSMPMPGPMHRVSWSGPAMASGRGSRVSYNDNDNELEDRDQNRDREGFGIRPRSRPRAFSASVGDREGECGFGAPGPTGKSTRSPRMRRGSMKLVKRRPEKPEKLEKERGRERKVPVPKRSTSLGVLWKKLRRSLSMGVGLR